MSPHYFDQLFNTILQSRCRFPGKQYIYALSLSSSFSSYIVCMAKTAVTPKAPCKKALLRVHRNGMIVTANNIHYLHIIERSILRLYKGFSRIYGINKGEFGTQAAIIKKRARTYTHTLSLINTNLFQVYIYY